MSKVRLEVELEVRPRDLKDLAEDYAREGTDGIFKYWTTELRGSRLVTELASEEKDENATGNNEDAPAL